MTTLAEQLSIGNMTQEELAMVLGWAAREGWNPGLADARAFYAADPQGFLLARLEGRAVGSVSVVRYGPSFAFLGLYMVEPALRGQGIGRALGAAAAGLCGQRMLGLDGVVAQQPTYASLGFVKAFSSLRYEARGGGADPGGAVELAGRWEQVLALDAQCFPAPREAFLRQWLAYPGGAALGVAEGGDLVAYGLLRPCQVGHKIGPLFARTPAAAERLFLAFLARAGTGPVYLDAPQNNPEAVALVERHGLTPVFECGRMYYRDLRPPWADDLVYGITTFELG